MLPAPRARFFATSSSLCIDQIYFICSYMGIGIHRHSIPCRKARCYFAADRLKEDRVHKVESMKRMSSLALRWILVASLATSPLITYLHQQSAVVYADGGMAQVLDAKEY